MLLKKILYLVAKPKVYIYILMGVAIIFLTFFTSNNALEIAISGVASVFIGIGVNNFTAVETHQQDYQKLNYSLAQLIKIASISKLKMANALLELNEGNCDNAKNEVLAIEGLLELAIQILQQETLSNK